jgi:peptidoglycan/LPS O-acetylase OafA/YrhL
MSVLESPGREIEAHPAEPSEAAEPPKRAADPGQRRVVQLDFVRGIAILLVMEHHFFSVTPTNWVEQFLEIFGRQTGWMGVDLFFVLSGFLVGGLLVQELQRTQTIRVGRFLLRRMFKIWPGYYFYVFFEILLHRHPLHTFLWQNLLNIQNYAGSSLLHTWSLSVEEHFYLLLPVTLLLIYRSPRLRRWTPHILLSLCLLVLLGRLISVFHSGVGNIPLETHTRIDGLLFGVFLSYLLYMARRTFDRLLEYRLLWALLTVLVFTLAMIFNNLSTYMVTFGYTVNYLCFTALLLLVYGYHGRLTGTAAYRVMAWIGRYSYGIYLWHMSVRSPILALVRHLPASMQWYSLTGGQYLAAIVLGVMVTKAIEFPMLRLRDRLFPRGAAQLPPAIP